MLPPRLGLPAFGVALTVALAVALTGGFPATSHALTGASWIPTDWTGVTPGAPVPGTGLPPAPVPAPLTPMPAGVVPVITYEPQTTCEASPKPGALRLDQIIRVTYGAGQTIWIPRGCSVGDTSEHKEGRAIDWMVSVRDPQQRANAETFLGWLLGPDQVGRPYGHALQLGVMYIGWHDRIWRGYGIDRGWQELKGCFSKTDAKYDNYCHRNHIHISLTRQGATGLDPTSTPASPDPSALPNPAAPPPPEAPLDESVMPEMAAPVAPLGVDSDLFVSIGAEPGYRTGADGPLRPGGMRTVTLASVPTNATSALVSVTTRKARASTGVRVGITGRSGATATVRASRNRAATSVLSVPVSDGTLQIGTTKAPVDVAIDVLGYAIDNGVYPAVGAVSAPLHSGRFDAGEAVQVRARGAGAVPRKQSKATAVILRVVARGSGESGRFSAYPVGGADLGTRSAVIPAQGRQTSVVVADIGRNGEIMLASTAPAQVEVDVVGYVAR